ncbi:MAG TPA: MerR family transcriptional regulator [Actinomycetota bacterium]
MSAAQPTPHSSRSTMSIGQVLSILKPDFPDVSVSKIRFLESEGLIDPQRTASGYRKFSQPNLDRLRTILKLQRDSYLPLKVIRQHLAALDAGLSPPTPTAGEPATPGRSGAPPTAMASVPVRSDTPSTPAPPAPVEDIAEPAPNVRLTESDLADQTGLELGQVRTLREFGVLCVHDVDGVTFFDGDDLLVADLARDFLKLGVDARHLKTLRRFAEQEAAMYEQLVTPALRNRKPEARKQAVDTLRELSGLSRRLRHAYVRQSLRDLARDG